MKRKVFSLALKDGRVEQCLRSCGNEFQMWDPKQERVRKARVLRFGAGFSSSFSSASSSLTSSLSSFFFFFFYLSLSSSSSSSSSSFSSSFSSSSSFVLVVRNWRGDLSLYRQRRCLFVPRYSLGVDNGLQSSYCLT